MVVRKGFEVDKIPCTPARKMSMSRWLEAVCKLCTVL